MPDNDPISLDLRMSNAEIEALIREYERLSRKPPKLLTPLPRRVRLRIWRRKQLTSLGIWLADRGHLAAATRLWKIFRMV